ncbi:MAG: M1 family metallopeptidase [Saprospiraceae bacterium]|nr:M1 family metallopeptidase [Saprospiraceae bacterium]
MKQPFFIALFLFPFLLPAQTENPYFQQEVNYRIVVTLDDKTHTLTGNIEMDYLNNSPDVLPEIWIHLWGNAFKNRETAFCKQKLRDGNREFYFAEEKDLGYYKNLDFTADGQKTTWKYDRDNPDIAKLTLPKALAPGERIRIATPFLLKIPASFSRLGHVETSYQMTQWYPKPAVYDNRGWHAMPYLDMGEFYSEFGNFDVTITLPANYVVGATGMLQTPAETAFLNKKELETREWFQKNPAKNAAEKLDTFPPSSPEMKTIRYLAEQVHDFAWFADKRFFVLKDQASLASGKTVDCWAMFSQTEANLWQKGAFYVRRSVEFYSKHVGEYPWPQATAVHSALSAGGGMEYPMITVIGDSRSPKSLDEVITHEVGHNWFYGILASNEREHPFLDEGMNSYYEYRYMREYYNNDELVHLPKFLLDPSRQGSLIELAQLALAREHVDTPPDRHSNNMSQAAYGVQVYTKTGTTMRWLEQSVGTELFDRAMQAYYRDWQFRHPYPNDLRASWKNAGLDADWWFELMQTQKQADVAIGKIGKENNEWHIDARQKGSLVTPFPVSALKDGKTLETKWFKPGEKVVFPGSDADVFVIDNEHVILDVYRKNNRRKSEGAFAGLEPFQLKMLNIVEDPTLSTTGVLPWVGWNNYDKTMLGVLLYNAPLPSRRLQYYIAPGFGLGSGQLVGLADLRYKFFPGGIFPKITLGVSAKTFDFSYNAGRDYREKMMRLVPQLRLELADRSLSFRHFLNVRAILLDVEEGQVDGSGFTGKDRVKTAIFETRYEATQKRSPNPWQFKATLENSSNYRSVFGEKAPYVRGSIEWAQHFYYQEKRKISARFFAGAFLDNTQRNRSVEPNAFALNPQGFNDYRFDQVFLGRSAVSGLLSRQVSQTEGGFKGAFGSPFASVIGNSNNFLLALNLKADLPQRLPFGIQLKPYFDIGYFDDATLIGQDRPQSEQLLWSGGFILEFFKGGFEFYLPVVSAKLLKDRYAEQRDGNYLRNITWSVRVPFREPGEAGDYFLR